MKRLGEQTLYEILEVPFEAAPAEIEAAYDRARALYAADSIAVYSLMTPEDAALLTSRIEEAKRTLLDPDARARYDDALTAPSPSAAGANGVPAPPPLAPAPPVVSVVPPVVAALPPVIAALPAAEPEEAPVEPAPVAEAAHAEAAEPSAPAPIRLEREVAPAAAPRVAPAPPAAPATIEIPLPEGALWTGEAIRRVREARGITIQQIAERTKVTRHHVENIEAERYPVLPAPVYLRGILLSLARELRLDGQKVARAYLERVASAAQDAKAR